jgi:hypothetical protein
MKVRFGRVICEVWDEDEEQWILVDPDRNYINLQASRFGFPSQAWNNYKNNRLPDVTYSASIGKGTQAILHMLLLDQAFVLGDVRNYWHTPSFLFTDTFSVSNFKADQLQIIDRIAGLMNEPGIYISELQQLYDKNGFLNSKEQSLDIYYEK